MIVIIDSNNSFSRAAKNFLLARQDVSLVHVCKSFADAIIQISDFNADLLLIDEHNCFEEIKNKMVVKQLLKNNPTFKVLTMSLYKAYECCNSGLNCIAGDVSKENFAAEILPHIEKLTTEKSQEV